MRPWFFLGIALCCITCDTGASLPGLGLDQSVRVSGAQLVSGALQIREDGPKVSQVARPQTLVERGEAGVVLNGRLSPGSTALHLQADGDANHWIHPTKGFDFVVDDELNWSVELEFSHAIQDDEVTLLLQAADKDGRLGPIRSTSFSVAPSTPAAKLLVSLAWDAPVDLDLHLETPDGTVIGAKNISSYEPPSPGEVHEPDAWQEAGWHDFDSNQSCELDLRNRENIVWVNSKPPRGTYKIYAHLFSACNAASVNLFTVAQVDGETVTQAASTLYEFDSRVHPSDASAPGLLLGEFTIQ